MTERFRLESKECPGLVFGSMTLEEALGRPYAAYVDALALDRSIRLEGLLGSSMGVIMEAAPSPARHLHGIVVSAERSGEEVVDEMRYTRYRFALAPRLALLAHTLDSRIFRDVGVPDIVRRVLAEAGCDDVEWRLSASYPVREYCVQYRESHLDFISRLMEEEGIYYFFEHAADRHTMIMADAVGAHPPAPGATEIPFVPPMHRGHRREATIDTWTVVENVTSARIRLGDRDYLHPGAPLAADRTIDGAEAGRRMGLEVVDFPGASKAHAMDANDLDRRAQVRGEAMNARRTMAHGRTDAVGIATGVTFRLREHPVASANGDYLVVSARIDAVGVDRRSGDGEDAGCSPFRCTFQAMPASQPYRSAQVTPRPVVHGLQTAMVDGSAEEDVETDEHGRVRVKFFWGTNGGKEAQASCPVRVASSWAGRRWGALHLPRVGQEVVVGFLEGDPDRPLVLGSVYNQDHRPPYALPEEKARSGIVSRSVGGAPGDANELRFDDSAGKEELYLHAQRDLRQEAENDGFVFIGRDAAGETGRDRTQDVGRDDALKVGRRLTIEAAEQIELAVGAARLVMKRTGDIQLVGTTLTVTGLASVNVTAGANLALSAGAATSIKAAAAVSVQGGAAVSVQAGAVLSLTAVGPAMLKGLPPLVG